MSALAGRRVLVTGAGSGIGRATVEAALAAGARCAGMVRDADERASQVGQLGAALVRAADLHDEVAAGSATAAAVAALGGVDGLVTCGRVFDRRTGL